MRGRSHSPFAIANAAKRLALLIGALVFCLLPGVAHAQDPVQRPTRLPAYGRSIVSNDDTHAIVQNPANIAFLPSWELRWSGYFLDGRARTTAQGHAFAFALPLPYIPFSTGIRLDAIDPPGRAVRQMIGTNANYQWLTWALAFKASESSSIGVSLQRTYSDVTELHDLSSWSVGITTRPFNGLGFAATAQHLNGPRNEGGLKLGASYTGGIAIRPFGSRVAELGLEASYIDEEDGYFVPRATLGVDIPPLGRVRGEFAMSDPTESERERAFTAAASLAVNFNSPRGSLEASAGTVFGNGLGDGAESDLLSNLYTDLAVRGFREPVGFDAPAYGVRIRIEDTPSTRGHVALLRRLWSLAEDEGSVRAVVFELRTSPGASFARVSELRDAIYYLRSRGKKVLCHLEDSGGTALYLCSAADRILINPAGGIRFAGLRTQYFYFRELLDKLGIRAQFVRIGGHKSAPERLTRMSASDTARADKIDLLQQYELEFTTAVAQGRNLDPTRLRADIARGPFIAREAKAAGLVDAYAFDDQVEAALEKLVGQRLALIEDRPATRSPEGFRGSPGIAIVYVDGDMIDGRSDTIPFLGMKLAGSYTIAEALEQARESPNIAAVVLRVETGGGSAMAADVIWREVQLTAARKPVIVSMGSAAASGGYYISAPATRIFANPLSITGSIGIFYGKADIAQLLRRIGVNLETFKTAPRADAESIFRPFSPEELKELQRKVGQFYDMFLTRVATGRKMTKAAVDKVARGRVWTGKQAASLGLVDEIGGLRQALAYARQLADIPKEAPITELPPPDTSLLGRILGIEGLHAEVTLPVPSQFTELIQALGPFVIHPADKPLARAELVSIRP